MIQVAPPDGKVLRRRARRAIWAHYFRWWTSRLYRGLWQAWKALEAERERDFASSKLARVRRNKGVRVE